MKPNNCSAFLLLFTQTIVREKHIYKNYLKQLFYFAYNELKKTVKVFGWENTKKFIYGL
jgi:hypothetical protein